MKKIPPQTVRFLLAENVREETLGKVTIVGLYSGDEVILQGDLPKEIPKETLGIALSGLTILITFKDGYGEFALQVQVIDPNGTPLAKTKVRPFTITQGSSANLIMPLIPFPVRAFGRYHCELKLDKQSYKYSFIVRHQDPNASLPTPQTVIASGEKKSPLKRMKARKDSLAHSLSSKRKK